MEKIKTFSLGIAMLINFLAFGQEKTITGKVIEGGLPLPGVSVVVKKTTRATQTDIDGNYSIKAKTGEILVFSFIGMKEQSITVGASNIINVTMAGESMHLENIMVTALGIKSKRNATTSSNRVVKTQYLTHKANPNVTQSLAGKVSGVQITNGSKDTKIVLRGNRSVNHDNKALIVVNNQIVTAETLRKLKPENIESTNVLKGAQGAALYGEQGVNGVIVVKTFSNLSRKDQKELDKLLKTDKKGQQTVVPIVIPNEEDYDSFVENPFTNPKNEALSTFSIDVDNASYTNIRRFINNGQKVPKDAVRVEEMINFFKYNYPQPENKHPFSINTEYSDCPWNENHKLLKIGLQGKNIPTDALPPSNLVFLIDVSGSMNSQNRLPLLKESMKVLVNQLRKEDKVAMVVYAGAAGLVLPPTSGAEKQTIINALDNLEAGGSTAGGAGIELAYKTAQEHFIKDGNNRVVLATDGDFNVGASSDKDMETLIEEKRKSGVFLTCLGYGMGNYKDSKMEILADKGNGNYAYIDTIQEANRFLGKEFKGNLYAIAKDVKIQIEFNPKHVQSYRLIGYENRKLNAEDFENDAIDAGELGSGHTVTALYEIIPTGVKSEFNKETAELKYSKVATNTDKYSGELATVKFRYKKPDGDKSTEMVQVIENLSGTINSASNDLKFSAAVAWFGLKLRDSKLVTKKASSEIKALALQGKSEDSEGYKAEFIRLVEAVN
ncbi:von Willebrand factor type A domain-containing protein [Flavobacterium enshiense]|uniref:YfbK domain-containing protein n=1 Tax=Flavobacterium enshiense TaxID=1341165 RepID=UPI00345D1D3A